MKRLAALALAGLLWATPAPALEPLGDRGLAVVNGGGGEFFVTPVPITWDIAHSSDSGRVVHMAWLHQGQEPGSWSDKVSIQLFPGETDISGEQLLDQIARRYARDCRNLLGTETEVRRKRGRTVAFRLLGCTEHEKTGRGELALFRVVQGSESLYLVQRAWRTPTFDSKHLPFAREILGKTRLWLQGGRVCQADSPDAERACPPRLAGAIQNTSRDQPVTVVKLGDGKAPDGAQNGGQKGSDADAAD
ncbi:hypothetical protein CKO28_24065 [Rhodovibrio sodomensis]|uniref:Uncharacterized protein n=1 Tax=Rhodovibrio sodomensis TaxID=1088 RepID=A0ABS1DLU4_9PROT|nr:hypothetical protein [Rhodovibrio sodomensis]MBK1671087.1 hypothetical protein [Rhodovibrio sodomensis]